MTDLPTRVWLMWPNEHTFLCEICFEPTDVKDCYQDPLGEQWTLCQPCGEGEERAKVFCLLAGRYGPIRVGD